MDKRTLEKRIVTLLLLNNKKAYEKAYSLIKVLSRWFDIIDYLELFDEMINENLLIRKEVNLEGNYFLTNKARIEFYSNKSKLEKEIRSAYPNQSEVIETLFSNIEKE